MVQRLGAKQGTIAIRKLQSATQEGEILTAGKWNVGREVERCHEADEILCRHDKVSQRAAKPFNSVGWRVPSLYH